MPLFIPYYKNDSRRFVSSGYARMSLPSIDASHLSPSSPHRRTRSTSPYGSGSVNSLDTDSGMHKLPLKQAHQVDKKTAVSGSLPNRRHWRHNLALVALYTQEETLANVNSSTNHGDSASWREHDNSTERRPSFSAPRRRPTVSSVNSKDARAAAAAAAAAAADHQRRKDPTELASMCMIGS
uniref:Uncharacterized protein n=1 Tax=Plectus sambesii TaxID=2011161 RepID=A0A914X1K0_9BILA